MSYDKSAPFGIRFVGETLCNEKYVIKREKSDIAAFEYIVSGTGTLEINSGVTIAEISNALSYADQQYFSYCFKKATGLTPRKYRSMTATD